MHSCFDFETDATEEDSDDVVNVGGRCELKSDAGCVNARVWMAFGRSDGVPQHEWFSWLCSSPPSRFAVNGSVPQITVEIVEAIVKQIVAVPVPQIMGKMKVMMTSRSRLWPSPCSILWETRGGDPACVDCSCEKDCVHLGATDHVEIVTVIPLVLLNASRIESWSSSFPVPQTMKGIVEVVHFCASDGHARQQRGPVVSPIATGYGWSATFRVGF